MSTESPPLVLPTALQTIALTPTCLLQMEAGVLNKHITNNHITKGREWQRFCSEVEEAT